MVAGTVYVLIFPAAAQTQFTNSATITLPGPGPGNPPPTPSVPYPSNITVAGLTGTVTDVNLTLNGFNCSDVGNDRAYPEDVDILLVGPTGANLVVLSDIGGQNDVVSNQFNAINVTLDDEAATPLPADTQLAAGTYKPTDDDDDTGEWGSIVTGFDPFSAPAPTPSGATALSVFDGTDPNGTWRLYVVDDYPGPDNCTIDAGWTLEISSTADTTTTSTTSTTTSTTSTTMPTTTSTSTTSTTMPTTTTTTNPLVCDGRTATIVGTSGSDFIAGTAGGDVIVGLGGDDRIAGSGGDDVICGGEGNDLIGGDNDNDRLFGGPGNDDLTGGAGNDFMQGDAGTDRLVGGTETDTCVAAGDATASCETIT